MNIEDRLRDAGHARMGLVPPPRPLVLPDDLPEGTGLGAPSGPRPGRHWSGWLIPLTAAAAVVAIAGILVAVKGTPGTGSASRSTSAAASSSSTGTSSGIPPYYVTFDYPDNSSPQVGIAVADMSTGKTLATFKALPTGRWQGIATSASDSTFVVYGLVTEPNKSTEEVFYKLYVPPGDPQQAKLSPLTLTDFINSTSIGAVAVSPDGSMLALYSPSSLTANGDINGPGSTLRTYSLETGKVLRTWTVSAGGSFDGPFISARTSAGGSRMAGLSGATTLQWLDDGHTLAWTSSSSSNAGTVSEFRTLNTSSPGTSLVADSRTLLRLPDTSCSAPVLTADGKSFICDSNAVTVGVKPCATRQSGLTSYSVATGKLEHVLYRFAGTCEMGSAGPDWAPSGSLVIGTVEEMTISGTVKAHDVHTKTTNDIGVMTPTKFTPLPIASTGSGSGLLIGSVTSDGGAAF